MEIHGHSTQQLIPYVHIKHSYTYDFHIQGIAIIVLFLIDIDQRGWGFDIAFFSRNRKPLFSLYTDMKRKITIVMKLQDEQLIKLAGQDSLTFGENTIREYNTFSISIVPPLRAVLEKVLELLQVSTEIDNII
jgi:hypothetical protein